MSYCSVQSPGRKNGRKKKSEIRNWEANSEMSLTSHSFARKCTQVFSRTASNFPQTSLSPFHAFFLCHLHDSLTELYCPNGPWAHANSWPGAVLPVSLSFWTSPSPWHLHAFYLAFRSCFPCYFPTTASTSGWMELLCRYGASYTYPSRVTSCYYVTLTVLLHTLQITEGQAFYTPRS